jgi:hypothetical protein
MDHLGKRIEFLFSKKFDLSIGKSDNGRYIVTASRDDIQITSGYEKTLDDALEAVILGYARNEKKVFDFNEFLDGILEDE